MNMPSIKDTSKWKFAAIPAGFIIGFTIGKFYNPGKKKEGAKEGGWGNAFKWGGIGALVGCTPLIAGMIFVKGVKIGGLQIVAPGASTDSIMGLMAQFAASENKQSVFDSKKADMTAEVDKLSDSEKNAFYQMLKVVDDAGSKKLGADDTSNLLNAKLSELTKTYGADFITALDKKTNAMEAKYGLATGS